MSGTNKAAPEVEEAVSELTPEEMLAAQKEGFEEALSTSHSVEAAPAVAPEPQPTEPEPVSVDAAPESEAQPEAAVIAARELAEAGWTKEKLAEISAKADKTDKLQAELSKAFGKMGSIEQQLKVQAEAASGKPLTDEDVADLKAAYGEEMADVMLKTLNKVIAGRKVVTHETPQPADTAALLAAAKEESRMERERTLETLLTLTHRDWREVTGVYDENGIWLSYQPKFAEWMSKLPANEQQKLRDGWDTIYVSDKLTDYKKHLQAEADAEAARKEEEKKAAKTPSRIKAAVAPKGGTVTQAQKSDLDWQREGYREAM